ncbi:MAG: metal ABC transporter permease [Candidatus Omnitrophica bacterium]|nr:metal ABC transporter permease [Candidatus Omnitrophota bacterium]
MNSFSSQIIDALHYAFIQRAILAGVLIALCCSFLGIFLVLRRFSLIGDGLAHVSFAAIALGLLLKQSPLLISVPIVVVASLLIFRMTEKSVMYGDAAIGLLSAVGIAVGVTLASISGGFNVDIFSYLFGNILSISKEEIVLTVILSAIVIFSVLFFYHDLFAVSFDNDNAKVMGVKTSRVNYVLLMLTSLTVVLGIKVVGTMLVSSLIIFPAVSALQIARNFKAAILFASILAILSVLIGIAVSYVFDLPAGATIVEVNFTFFVLAFLARRLFKL